MSVFDLYRACDNLNGDSTATVFLDGQQEPFWHGDCGDFPHYILGEKVDQFRLYGETCEASTTHIHIWLMDD